MDRQRFISVERQILDLSFKRRNKYINRSVLVLLAMYQSMQCNSDKKNKLDILDYYSTKDCVDFVDQKVHKFSSKRKTCRLALDFVRCDWCDGKCDLEKLTMHPGRNSQKMPHITRRKINSIPSGTRKVID